MRTRRFLLLGLSSGIALASLAALLVFLNPASASTIPSPKSINPGINQSTTIASQLSTLDAWLFECADCPRMFAEGSDHALRLDADGNSHLAYGRDHLYYAWYDGTDWRTETADPSPFVGIYTSLAVDTGGAPRISYYDALSGVLKFAWRDDSGWHYETVAGAAGGGSTSLALDEDGEAVITYWDEISNTLKVAFQGDSGWTFEYPDPSSYLVGENSSLAVDQLGNLHIAYASLSDSSVRYAYRGPGGWITETAATGANYGEELSIAVDGDEHPHISFLDGWPNYDLKYTYRTISDWQLPQTVDSVTNAGFSNSIAVDGSGDPHISYWADNTLRYASLEVSGWQSSTVDASGSVGVDSSLALDENGNAQIAYYDTTQGLAGYKIKHARQTNGTWQSEVVDTAGNVGAGVSLALDRQGFAHLSYQDTTWHDLKYVYQDASGWHQETVDSAGEVGLITSLAIDQTGYAHIGYYDASNQDLKYAYQDASGWHIASIDQAGTVGTSLSLALDSAGNPHISYYAASPKDLRYASVVSGDWVTQTVDSLGDVGLDNSLALDSAGMAHISYFDNTGDELLYAAFTPGGWVTTTVDTEAAPTNGSSIALGASGSPSIAYYFAGGEELRYARWISPTWSIETVDSTGNTGGHPSLELDASGTPHISYTGGMCPGPCGRLVYAVRTPTSWMTETVDASNPNTGWYSSLELMGGGYPRIGYFDALLGDLKLATTPIALTGLDLLGPISGEISATYAFTASAMPPTATLPITTLWEATDQPTIQLSGGLTQALTYTWTTTGSKIITVTAWNPVNSISTTHSITISVIPIQGLAASNDSPTLLGLPTSLIAAWTAGSSPSFAWDFGDGHGGAGAVVTHTYEAAGVYTATVTASNPAGSAQASTEVLILTEPPQGALLYLPVVLNGIGE